MPLFGLFPKKSKQSATTNQVSSVSPSYSPSDNHSSTNRGYKNYVLPDIASPTSSVDSDVHVRRGQHSDRPQGRGNDPPVGHHSHAGSNGTRSAKVPHDSSKLQPPPSRSAVFGGYAYSSDGQTSRSTLSLPEGALALKLGQPAPPQSPTLSRPRSSSTQEGWGGSERSFKSSSSKSKIFGWMSFKAKSSTPSLVPTSPSIPVPPLPHRKAPLTPPTIPPEKRSSSKDDDSFKVTSFRHVRPVSPGLSIPYANTARPKNSAKPTPSSPFSSPNLSPSSTSSRSALNPLTASRSRHDSVDSESSQKVTVATFLQAQARRSSVNLVRSSIHDPSSTGRTELIDTKPPSRINTPPQPRPPSSLVPDEFKSLFSSDSLVGTPTSSARTIKPDSPTRSSFATDVEDQSPGGTMKLARQDTITQRTASNGIGGHSHPPPTDSSVPATVPPLRPPRLARPPPPAAKPSVPASTRNSGKSEDLDFPSRPGSQTSGTLSAYRRSQASVSTPALPSAMKGGRSSRLSAASDTSDDDEEDSDSDEEDLPLVKLVGPKRPGTSMSVVSTATRRTNSAFAPAPSPRINSPSSRPMDPNSLLPSATVKPSQRSRAPLADSSRRDDDSRSTPPTANQRSSVPTKPSAPRSSSVPVPSPLPAGLFAPTGLNRPSHHDVVSRSTSPASVRQSANQRSSSVPVTISSDTTPATNLKRPTRDPASGRPSAYANRPSRINHSPPSSTGDSSNGKLPLTPRDGSEPSLGGGWNTNKNSRSVVGSSSNVSRLGHTKRPSVSFELPSRDSKGISTSPEKDAEAQRRERRRSEAKAAIELGVVVNGPPPVIDDHDDTIGQFTALQQRQAGWEAWQAQARTSMFSNPIPTNFGMQQLPPTPDANFLAAHQQAMLIAKQTYQMTIAQQALQAANDEWERSSNVTAFGMQGSVYGNPAMMGPMNMGMGAGMGVGGLPMFPPAPASMYAGGGSTIVGSRPPSNWGTGSVYGASFGPAPNRRSGIAFPQHGTVSDFAGPVAKGRPRTRTAPSNSLAPNAHGGRGGPHKSSAAPSSWRMS